MNKTITINLAGINFYIDEDAYHKLDKYLKSISASLDSESRTETMQDIEARIAELFLEDIKDRSEVITMPLIDKVIGIMGQPSDYQMNEENEEPQYTQTAYKTHKKLYRDIDRKIIGGVSGGLSHYFNIDIIWFRLAFIVFFLPFGVFFRKVMGPVFFTGNIAFWTYVILWIITPGAKTTRQKLEMQGEQVNVDNIERKVKENFADSKARPQYDAGSQSTGSENVKSALSVIGVIIAKLVGAFMLFIGGSALLGLLFSLISSSAFTISGSSWIDYVVAADIGVPFWLGTLLVFLALAIPMFYVFWFGLKILVTRIKLGVLGNSMIIGLWIISLFAIGGLGIRQATIRAFNHNVTESAPLQLTPGDTLKIDLLESKFDNRFRSGLNIIQDQNEDKKVLEKDVYLTIKSTADNPRIEVRKFARGKSFENAKENVEGIDYGYKIEGNKLMFNDFFTLDLKNIYKEPQVRITLYLPENQIYIPSKNIYRISLSRNIPRSYLDKLLILENEGSKCLNCPEPAKEKEISESKQDSAANKNTGDKKEIIEDESEWYREKN